MAVEVTRGPLEGIRGILLRKGKRHRLVISVHLIQQAAVVIVTDHSEYDWAWVVKSSALIIVDTRNATAGGSDATGPRMTANGWLDYT